VLNVLREICAYAGVHTIPFCFEFLMLVIDEYYLEISAAANVPFLLDT
jgi:hypothetical protein